MNKPCDQDLIAPEPPRTRRRLKLAAAMGLVPVAAAVLGASSVRSRLWSGVNGSRHAPAAVVSEIVKTSSFPAALRSVEEASLKPQDTVNRLFTVSNRSPFSAFGSGATKTSRTPLAEKKRSASEKTEGWSLPELDITESLGAFADVLMQVATLSGTAHAAAMSGSPITAFPSTFSFSSSCVEGANYSSVYIYKNDYYGSFNALGRVRSSSSSITFTNEQAALDAYNSCVYQDNPPPSFDDKSATASSSTEIVISVDMDKGAKIYYAVSSARLSPTVAMIRGLEPWIYPDSVVTEGIISPVDLDSDFLASVTVSGLSAGETYYVYLVAEDPNDSSVVTSYEEVQVTTGSAPSFDAATDVTNVLTPYRTDSGYGGARNEVELSVNLSIEADIHYVVLPTGDAPPTAAEVFTMAADSDNAFSGVIQGIAKDGTYAISGLDAASAYMLYSVATYPGNTSFASALQSTSLELITGNETLLFDDWARLDDPANDYVTFYDKTPTISGSAHKDATLFAKLNGDLLADVDSPQIPTSPTGTPQCVNLADSCANYLAHWHITLDAAISNDIQELEIISDNGSGILERSVLKFKVSEPPEKFRTTVSPEGTSGDQYNFEFSPYERASNQDMTLLTWNGERYVKYTSGITGTLTYRGRATNWGEGGGGMAWATLYPDGQMIIMINYGKAGAEGKTFTFDTNDSEIFSGFELDDTIEAPTKNAQAEKEISYTWSSHPGAMYKQVWRDDKINNWRDYYDPDIGLTMMLGANNSMDWILARDMNISLNLKTVVLPATDYYLPIPDGGPSQFSTTNLDAYRAWRQNLTDSGGNFQPTAVNVQSDLTYCDTVTQSSACTGEIPETNLKFIHVVGYGLGGRSDLDAGNFFKMFTNLTRQKAGTGLHELGHTLGLGHCYNQRDTMCGGGGFWFGRDTQKRTKQFISSFTQGGETLRTGTTYAAPLPPYSGEDYHRMTAGTTALIDVVANDVDFNGDTVTISEVDSETFFGGTARIEAGKVRYAPPSGFTGVDYFSYKIQSGTVATNGYFTNTAHASVYVTPADTTEPVVHFNFEEASYDILNNIADLDNTIFAYIKPKSGGSEFTFATPGAKIDGAVGKGFTPTGTSGIILKHYPEPIDQSQTTSMWFNLVDVSGFGADDISILWDSDPSTISVTRVSNEFKLNVKVVPEGSYGLDATFSAALDVTTPNEWHHVALVINREDNTVKAYLDGQEISDGVSGDQPFSNGFATIPGGAIFKGKSTASIGTVNEPGVEEGEDTPDFAASSDDTVFNSAVDEFKIFNRALTPADIESEYNNIASDSTLWRSHNGILSNQLKGGGFNKVGVESSAVSGLNFNTTTSGRVLSIEVSHPDYQGDREYPSEGYEFDERFVEIRNQNGEIGSISRFLGFYKSEIDYSLRFDLAKKRSKNRPAMDFNVWAGGSYADHSGAVKVASASIANNTTSSDPAWVDTTISLNDLGADTSTLSANTPIWLEITNKPGSSEGAASLIDNLVVTVTGLPIDDSDSDGDGVSDADDAFPNDASETADTDGDGVGNNEDTDDDGDGVLDTADAFPLISLNGLTDTDGDGRPNDCDSDCQTLGMTADTDDDGDGYTDVEEIEAGSDPTDANDEPLNTGLPVWLLYQATQ